MGKETEVVTVQPQAPTVAEATRDSTPPLRATKNPVLVNNIEYTLLAGKLPRCEGQEFSEHNLPLHGGKDTMVLAEQEQREGMASIAFGNEPVAIPSTENLPNNVADPEAVGREVKERARENARVATEKQLKELQEDLQDPKLMDVLARLLGHPKREKIYIDPRAIEAVSERGKQCGGGGGGGGGGSGGGSQGSQAESNASQSGQGGFGQSSLVVGGFSSGGGGGLGGSGGGDDDPNNRRPYNPTPSHYADPVVFEEQPMTEDEQLRHAMSALLGESEGVVLSHNDPLFPQFTKQHEEPLSASLDHLRPGEILEGMDFDLDILCGDSTLSQYLPEEPISAMEPAEETTLASYQPLQPSSDLPQATLSGVDITNSPQILVEAVQPQSTAQSSQPVVPFQAPLPVDGGLQTQQMVMQAQPQSAVAHPQQIEEKSEIQESFDLINLMRHQTAKRPSFGGPVLSLSANVLSYPGVTPTTPHPPPSPAPSAYSNMAASPMSRPFTPFSTAPLPSPLPPPTPTSLAPIPSPHPPSTPGTPAAATPCTPASHRVCGPFIIDTSIRGDRRICELSISPDLPPERRTVAFRAMLYINTFYNCVYQCAREEMDLKVANDVHAKMCQFNFDDFPSLTVTFSMPKDCKPLQQWLKKNNDLKDRLLVLQQVLNTLATIHTRGHEDNLSLWGSFMVFVGSDLRVYILVDVPMLLQKQEALDPRMLDVVCVSEIYTNLVKPCIGKDDSWASPALTSALMLFERCLGSDRSSCRMAEAARILGEKRVCKVEVDVCLPVVFYCLEREELQTALRDLSQIAPSGIAHMWAVQSATGYMRVGDIVTADRRMQLRLVPIMHPTDTRLLYICCQQQ